jgi:hypothetical protein
LPFACVHHLEHLFSSSNNNRLTWWQSMCFCTSAPSLRCLDGNTMFIADSTTVWWEEIQV